MSLEFPSIYSETIERSGGKNTTRAHYISDFLFGLNLCYFVPMHSSVDN